jgi:hypothetical protein
MNALSSRSIKLGSKLYLATVDLDHSKSEVKDTQVAVNHVFCCDISGSMSLTLPKMRTQLKNRISEIVAPQDTVTIIVFSGRNECTTIKELAKVNDVKSLKELNDAIDRYMKPIGMTCFLDPVEYTNKLIDENKGNFNWIFLSDGGNNDAPWTDVIKELTKLAPRICGSTIIEYGYWADTAKLNEMTEILGGTKIVAEDFDAYVPVIETALKGKSESRIVVDVASIKPSMRYTQFIYLKDGNVYVVVANGTTEISIPESVETLYYLANKSVGEIGGFDSLPATYAMAYVMASYLRYEVVENILAALKDEKFIEQYSTAYGKQKLFQFQADILKAVFDESERGKIVEGYKPNPNRYSIIDLFTDLQKDETEVFVASPMFNYNRIGAKSVNKVALSDKQKDALLKAKTKKDVDKVKKEVDATQPVMTMIDRGYPISNFVWNEDRANLSAQFMIDVTLEMPKNNYGISAVDSFVFRNYTIIKDGILNVSELPVKMSDDVKSILVKKCPEIMSEEDENGIIILDLTALPLVNKKQTQKVKMHEMTEKLLTLTTLKFKLKYLGYLKKKLQLSDDAMAPRFYKGNNPEVIAWLAGFGITDKGYQPKTELDKTGDFYMALTFKTDFKSFSSIPKIEDIEKKLSAGKSLTPSELFLRNIMLSIDATYLDGVKGLAYDKAVRSTFNQLSSEKNKLQQELGAIKFGMILSRKWFSDCTDMSQDTDSITNQFGDEMTIQYRFTETKQNL